MRTLSQIKAIQKNLNGVSYTNTTFIMELYKPSTLPRMFYDLKLSVKEIDDNKAITKYLKSVKAIKDGFAQDNLFDLIEDERVKNLTNEEFVAEFF